MRRLVICLLVLLVGTVHATTEPLQVLATVGMIGDVAAEVGAQCVNVTTLMGPGTDPHLYRASAGDIPRLGQAQLVLYGGLHLEGRMTDVLERLARRTPTVAVMERIDRSVLLQEDAGLEGAPEEIAYDPHLWMDVRLWAQTVDILRSVLSEVRPDCAEIFRANAERYRRELLALHDWAYATLSSIPEGTRVLVTAHDAFYYFARAYGFEASEGIQGLSTESEASVADIRAVVDEIVARRIPAIFPETTINPRNIEAVRAAARDRGWNVIIGSALYSDALGDADTPEGTYIGMIRRNVLTITEALGGEVAAWPEPLADWAARWELADRRTNE